MANTLRLYRGTVISTDDPEGLSRIQLRTNRSARKSAEQAEGWVNAAALPFGIAALAKPCYAVGDKVLYAAERLPFVGAVVVCRENASTGNAASNAFTVSLGQGNEATIETANGALRLSTSAGQQVTLNANGSVEIAANEINLQSNSKIAVAAAMVTIDAGMVKFSGTVQCETIIATSVVGASYTPGAGNVW